MKTINVFYVTLIMTLFVLTITEKVFFHPTAVDMLWSIFIFLCIAFSYLAVIVRFIWSQKTDEKSE